MTTKMVPEDFTFDKTLGVGASSRVVVGTYKPDGKRYAIKMIPKRIILSAPTEEERNRMFEVARREMRMLMICDHPSIIQFYASMQTADDLMYVTSMCEGGELLEIIRRRGTIPLVAARQVTAELVAALDYLHSVPKRKFPIVPGAELEHVTILHRDIKPENIMLTEDNHVKLIDFGTAGIAGENIKRSDSHLSRKSSSMQLGSSGVHRESFTNGVGGGQVGSFCGTTQYMSPEILQDTLTCIPSDYWAVGCTLFHMLTGRRPFEGGTQYLLIRCILEEEVVFPKNMDSDAKDFISNLLVKNPSKRLGSLEMGGFAAVKRHPFFSKHYTEEDWAHLTELDVRPLWQRDPTWVGDDEVTQCKHCGKDFNLIRRKHHCRNCGNIFCDSCSNHQVHIPESTYKGKERVCDPCLYVLERKY
eukprot:Tbor_TRINITY_DN2570_c0_g1::TRINITY_DN2570_c0_g1_i1::g.516::m.516/K06276/PDPK1; 3-phosphoinositide dependent protein kinase-1